MIELFTVCVALCVMETSSVAVTMAAPGGSVTYEELLQRIKDGTTYLIDVRERAELENGGRILSATNIPLGELAKALQLSPQDFEATYGASKPSQSEPDLVVYCRSGRRSRLAQQVLFDHGFPKARSYDGSFLEWQEKGGPTA